MAVKSKAEILEALKSRLDDTSDETLALIEDVSDTLNNAETENKDNTDWKTKYEENDKKWRQKYRDRFFGSTDSDDDDKEGSEDEPESDKYEDLFSTKGDK